MLFCISCDELVHGTGAHNIGNKIGASGAASLADALTKNTALTSLDLGGE